MYKSDNKDIWRVFREHHYLSKDLNKACNLFLIYWDNTLVGMCSYLPMPVGTIKNVYRGHRWVVLPDYQGLGIGSKLLDFMGEYCYKRNEKFFARMTHTRLGHHCEESKKWKSTCKNKVLRTDLINNNSFMNYDTKRIAYSFEYVGEDYNVKEHQMIVCIGDENKENANKYLDNIIDNNKYPIIISGVANWNINNVWEEVAKERNIRTEILFVNNKGKSSINKSKLKNFDCIVTDKQSQEQIAPYKSNMNKCITYDFRKEISTLWKNF